jgi:hypothetical protein
MHAVKEWQELFVATDNGKQELNLVTSTLINYTMAIGVSQVSEQNIDEVSCRIALLESIFGAVLSKNGAQIFITRADVARHVGLRTEAPDIELAVFWQRMRALNVANQTAGLRSANESASALYSLYRLSTP